MAQPGLGGAGLPLHLSTTRPSEEIMTTQETTLRIEGMHCEGCAKRITNVLKRLEGVQSADVSLEDEAARVEHDTGTPSFEAMKEAIEKAGYTAIAEQT